MTQRSLLLAAALTAGLFASGSRADEYVVVESSAPAIKIGTELSSQAGLTVPDKARVVLLRADGQMVTVNGPHQGVPVSPPAGTADNRLFVAITSLVRAGAQQDSTRVAAVRAIDDSWRAAHARTARDILAVDTLEGGDTCLYEPAAAELIRSPANQGQTSILALTGAGSVAIAWPVGAPRVPWPKEVTLVDGASYVIEQEGHAGAAMTTVHILRQEPGQSELQRVAQLADRGCTSQARLWLRMLADQRK